MYSKQLNAYIWHMYVGILLWDRCDCTELVWTSWDAVTNSYAESSAGRRLLPAAELWQTASGLDNVPAEPFVFFLANIAVLLLATFASCVDFWIRNWSHLSSCYFCFSSCCWGDRIQKKPIRLRLFKSDRDEICHDCYSSRRLMQSNFDMTPVILSRSRLWRHFRQKSLILNRKVSPSGECTCSVCPTPVSNYYVYSSWSIVHSYCTTNFAVSRPL